MKNSAPSHLDSEFSVVVAGFSFFHNQLPFVVTSFQGNENESCCLWLMLCLLLSASISMLDGVTVQKNCCVGYFPVGTGEHLLLC